MKRLVIAAAVLFSTLLLLSCASTHSPVLNEDLARENWMRYVDTDSSAWTKGADTWFYTAEPNAIEVEDLELPYSAAVTTENVTVPNFTNIRIEGNYQVQIEGTDGPNSVTLLGPNQEVRNVVVDVQGNLLCLKEVDARLDMRHVIVRIKINMLHNLIITGCGRVEGIRLHGRGVNVEDSGTGNTYLSGNFTLRHVSHTGAGILTIVGARSPALTVLTDGPGGSTNISGQIFLTGLTHHGANNINILGASSDGLCIDADGGGQIAISGNLGIKEVKASSSAKIYLPGVSGNITYVYVRDNAVVGMNGNINELYVQTSQNGRFFGRYLCADNAFVRASDYSHINISGRLRVFASATEHSSIYFFGSPGILEEFMTGDGAVVPFWVGGAPYCLARPLADYKGETEEMIRVRPKRSRTPFDASLRRDNLPPPPPPPAPVKGNSVMGYKSQFKG